MKAINIKDVRQKELLPGTKVKFVHSENMSFAFWEFEEGVLLPRHSHPHEQVVNILDGELKLTVGNDVHDLKAGDMLVIPSNIEHEAFSITSCRVLDTFCPVREDYKGD